jgi:putative ABC transport system permease protein
MLLSQKFTILVIIAFALAVPIAWMAMEQWLQGFAYRVDISLLSFFLAGGLALLVAWLTISYQSIKAALANPVDSLRSE